jgi:hypothetical protein
MILEIQEKETDKTKKIILGIKMGGNVQDTDGVGKEHR